MNVSTTRIDLKKTGEKLRMLIELHGYKVKDIQEYLGLSCPQPIYRWYKGKILPSVDNLFRLSELLHIHMEELLVSNLEMPVNCDSIMEQDICCKKRLLEYALRLVA